MDCVDTMLCTWKRIAIITAFVAISMFCFSSCLGRPDKASVSYWHLSLDDVGSIMQDITANDYESIFDNQELGFLKSLHDDYGITVSLYCFYAPNDSFNLANCTDRYRDEFQENAAWLKVGYHGLNPSTNWSDSSSEEALSQYSMTMHELVRITGGGECIDVVPRLQNYKGNKGAVLSVTHSTVDDGIYGLLAPDDERNAYYLNEEASYELRSGQFQIDDDSGLVFVSTDIRFENTDDVISDLNNMAKADDEIEIVELFTHEWQLGDDAIKSKIRKAVEFAYEHHKEWSFAQNKLLV